MPERVSVSLILVSQSYPPVLGGSEIEAQRVCSGLIRRGHRVTVLCAGGAPMPDVSSWIDPAGVPVRILARGFTGRPRNIVFGFAVAWELIHARRDCQLVYFLMQGFHLVTGLPVARSLRIPIVMKVSGSNLITLMRKSWLGRLELRFLRRWAHRVMILNPGMAEEAAAVGFEPRHLLWMPNPVDTGEFAPCAVGERQTLRASLDLPAASPTAVFVGRLAPEKQLPSLLRAFAAALKTVPDARLILVGDGPERTRLESLVNQLDLGRNVRFTGRLTVPQVKTWLQAADLFALVSSLEGFPCSLVEAMSTGLPAVVSGIPANTQLIESGIHGLVAPLGDERALTEALARLLADPAARLRMGATARQLVLERYSTDKVLDLYEILFAEALKGRAPWKTPIEGSAP
jgi:glycosyltransferase involved in cell wall biosynthesis